MNRRSFFGWLAKGIATAALAGHMKLGELIPVTPQIAAGPPHLAILTMDGLANYVAAFEELHGHLPKLVWVTKEEWDLLNWPQSNVLALHHRGVQVKVDTIPHLWDMQWHRDGVVGYQAYPEPRHRSVLEVQ